jgi:hypothetical protein
LDTQGYFEAVRARFTIHTPATVTSPPAMASGAGDSRINNHCESIATTGER